MIQSGDQTIVHTAHVRRDILLNVKCRFFLIVQNSTRGSTQRRGINSSKGNKLKRQDKATETQKKKNPKILKHYSTDISTQKAKQSGEATPGASKPNNLEKPPTFKSHITSKLGKKDTWLINAQQALIKRKRDKQSDTATTPSLD